MGVQPVQVGHYFTHSGRGLRMQFTQSVGEQTSARFSSQPVAVRLQRGHLTISISFTDRLTAAPVKVRRRSVAQEATFTGRAILHPEGYLSMGTYGVDPGRTRALFHIRRKSKAAVCTTAF